MYKFSKSLVIAFVFLCATFGHATTLTGTVNNPDGSAFNGAIFFTLPSSTTISSLNGCSGPIYVPNTYKVPVDVVNGAIQSSPNLYDSNCMNPAGMPYNVELVSSTGEVRNYQWVITGTTENIGSIVPISTSVFVPVYVSAITCDSTMTCTYSGNAVTLHAIGGGSGGGSGADFPSNPGLVYGLTSTTSRLATSADLANLLNTSPSVTLTPSLFPEASNSALGAVKCDGTTTDCVNGIVSVIGGGGSQGATGPTGPAGTAATIALGTVSTGAAGSNASVTDSGNSNAAIFNFTIPQGEQGATGATGAAGSTGAAGPNTVSTSTATSITGLFYGNGSTVSAATANQINTLLQGLTGCTTTGYVYSVAAGQCVAQSGGSGGSGTASVIYSNIQSASDTAGTWIQCVGTSCAGGSSDTGTGSQTFGVASPSLSGAAMSQTSNGASFNTMYSYHILGEVAPTGGNATTATLSLIVPTPTVTANSITITASASDTTYTVTAIKVYQDGGSTAVYTSTGAGAMSYTVSSLVGSHTFTVKAFNSNGGSTFVPLTVTLGPNVSNLQSISEDIAVYVPSSTTGNLQALEFDPDVFYNQYEYFISIQCDSVSHDWRAWNMAAGSAGNWEDTGIACPLLSETNQWHYLHIAGTLNYATQQYSYTSFTFDGTTVFDSTAGYTYGARSVPGYADTVKLEEQIDNNTTATSNTIDYDDMTLTLGYGSTGSTDTGSSTSVTIGTTTTGAAGSSASVTNSGTSTAPILNFTIPQGAAGATGQTGNTGATGAQGSTGAAGAAATVAVGTVVTGSPGSSATVTNAGSSSAALFNFSIPQGQTGATGATGAQGNTGATGATGAAGPNALSTTTTTTLNCVLKGNGTDVACATAGTDYQAALGFTPVEKVASGSLALATSSIASYTCQAVTAGSVNSAAATGALTTDQVVFTPNGSIHAVVGYTPSSSGGLTVYAYPTAGYANFDVCNWTASAITPGAITVNWSDER